MKRSSLALAIAMAPLYAAADDAADFDQQLKLSDVVVTANRQAEDRSRTSSAVSVFTRDDIDRLQPTDLLDLLRRVPGMQVTRNGGRGSMTGVYLRGTKTAQTLVLVDGQRIAGADSGVAQLEALSIEQIERVEVLRGTRSAVYGPDAIGGVIQIFTRRATGEGLNPRVRLAYGSRSTWERSAGLSGGSEATRFSLNASSDETRGVSRSFSRNRPDSDHDAYRNDSLAFNLSHRFGERLAGGFSVLDQRGESEFDLSWGGSYPYNDFQVTSYSGYLDGQLSDRWNSRFELGHSENRSVTRYDDNDDHSPFNTYRESAAWLNTLQLGAGHSLVAGLDGYQEHLHTNSAYEGDERWNHALLLQHRYQGERISTEIGVRHDKNSQFGSENIFNGALTIAVDARNDLVLSYAEGFRTPTFMDLYYPGYANPDLKPERSKSYELQWRSQLARKTRLETSVYRIDLEDAISAPAPAYVPYNLNEARVNGLELALHQELLGWQGQLGLSLVDPRDRDTGHTLARRARRTLSLDIDRQFGEFSVGAGWQAVSRAYDDAENTREIAGYGLLGLRAGWQATPETLLAVKVDNLLDKAYAGSLYSEGWPAVYSPYREEGRTALLSVTWSPSL